MRLGAVQKLVITSVAAVLVAGAPAFLFWRLGQYVQNAEFAVAALESQLSVLEEERKAARRASALLEERSADIDRINRLLVERARLIDFIETLEGLAGRVKNKLALDFDEGQSRADALIFRLTIEGTELQARAYLKLLELLPYQSSISAINWQRLAAGQALPPSPDKKAAESKPTHRLTLTMGVRAR